MLDLKSSKYFSSLSNFIQESITQSGVDFDSEEELSEFVKNLENTND